MHSIDELVQARTSDSGEDPFAATSLVSAKPIPAGAANDLVDRFNKTDGVDGAVALIRAPVPVENTRAGLREPTVVLVGADPAHISGFESDLAFREAEWLPEKRRIWTRRYSRSNVSRASRRGVPMIDRAALPGTISA